MHDVISKICSRCETRKPIIFFNQQKSSLDGYNSACGECRKNIREKSLQKQIEVKEKQCIYCLDFIPIDNFTLNIQGKDGHANACRECSNSRRTTSETQECEFCKKIKFKHEFLKDKNTCKNCDRKASPKIEIEFKTCSKCGEMKNKTCFYKNNISKDGLFYDCKDCRKAYQSSKGVRQKINIRIFEYRKNPQQKLRHLLGSRILKALKNFGSKNNIATEEIIGTTVENCRIHLESLFLFDMTWENNTPSGWHIDHIIPCDAFDLRDAEERKKCFHYTNLMPRWATTEIARKHGSSQIGNTNKNKSVLPTELIQLK